MPPALRALQAAVSSNKASAEYQRLSWDVLRKSITSIVNRVNIKAVVPELAIGSSSLRILSVATASIINTKLPQVGELILARLISQFRGAFKRNDKIICHSTTTFIAHLVNQSVAHEIIDLLIERPTDDSIEITVGFMREVGAFLAQNSPKANATVFERFRAVLNELQRVKDKDKDNPILPEGLDLDEDDEEVAENKEGIEDRPETNIVDLRRTIYLSIMNTVGYEEAHKLP
ncbi:armadillo-type protein [Mycena galericulata]|nr:armadillo-type protein [Mycena galericulata]